MSAFLQQIDAESYGGLRNREVGPLAPGINVIIGPNEAGKSTLASLVGSVLFGWEDAHGVRNTFRPDGEGQRCACLTWADAESGNACATLRRDENGVGGNVALVDDIDRDAFRTVFSLTSDELRSLRGSSDMTARLLTAGTGTATSPSEAFVEVERRIANSPVYRLDAELDAKREEMLAAREREDLRVQEARELRELESARASALSRIDHLNSEVSDLAARLAELEASESQVARHEAELDELAAQREQFEATAESAESTEAEPEIDAATERSLRSQLAELSREGEKLDRKVEAAKENSAASRAAHEALLEIDDEPTGSRRLRRPPWQAAVAVLLPVAFVVAGVPLFARGREINSLSITALGVFLVLVAVFLAVAAFTVLFRTPREGNPVEERRKDAHWVMLQDQKKLDASLAEQAEFAGRLAAFLDDAGLGEANGSIRHALSLLDDAADVRAARADHEQRRSSLDARIAACERELSSLRQRRDEISGGQSAQSLAEMNRARTEERDALVQASARMGERFGELSRELEHARTDTEFSRLKFEEEQLRAQLREAKRELITLLLAKRLLGRSIAAWESQSQPEVYARAGGLLATITGGKWTGVGTSATGSLVALSADGTARDPRHLSLGTCQQLYLALRIALLIEAPDVGRAIPVLADDILVNFDADRRAGAARALAELAEHRQVIVFTCHEETAAALRTTAPTSNRIEL